MTTARSLSARWYRPPAASPAVSSPTDGIRLCWAWASPAAVAAALPCAPQNIFTFTQVIPATIPAEVHPSVVVERLPAPRGAAAARNAGLLMAASMGAEVRFNCVGIDWCTLRRNPKHLAAKLARSTLYGLAAVLHLGCAGCLLLCPSCPTGGAADGSRLPAGAGLGWLVAGE